ncbi:MCE family protein [Actinomadura scrupuli]|uniref:MCE family protein n=1 Tax=Actinomadura scrupuli TaxID=559629 RepID=UPI003D955A64
MAAIGARKRGRGPDRGSLLRFAVFAVFTGLLTFFIGQQITGTSFSDRYTLVGTFDDVTGLLVGDQVKVAGAPVGRVGGIKVKDGRAEVRMQVDKEVRLPVDSTASIRWRSLIGTRQIYLEPGRSTSMLTDGARVQHTLSVVDLGDIVNSLGPLTRSLDPDQINQVLQAFATTLDGNENNINLLTSNLDGLLQTFAARSRTIDQMVKDYKDVSEVIKQRDGQIARSVDNLAAITELLDGNSKLLNDTLVQVSGVTTSLDQVLGGQQAQLGRVVDNLARFTGTFRLNVDKLELMVQELPLALRRLFAAGNGGHFLRTDALCLNVVQGPCPFRMQLPGATAGNARGAGGRQYSYEELKKLAQMLRGGR